jgi:ElaB/YqjD/DUF883 family membrane-anchored ribosome-binding protein
MKHITDETPRRITTYPGETADEYVRAREQAQDLLAFEAKRLVDNGWTANLERSHQKNAAVCILTTPNGEQLITALETAEENHKADRAKREQALRTVQAKLGQTGARSTPAPQQAAQDAMEALFDEEDPGADIPFDAIPYGKG